MHIVVCVKQVPDSWADKHLSDGDFTLDRVSADAVLNELDEYAVEEALRLRDAAGGSTVTVLSMGPARSVETIRKALAMGADAAVHLLDDQLHGSDAVGTSYALAAALGTLEWDLLVLGSESTDARMSVLPAMLAERLDVAQLTAARRVTLDGRTVRIERQTDAGYDVVEAELPAVVSVVEKINSPRYPSFKGIVAAKKAPLTILTLADIGVEPASVGLAGARSRVLAAAAAPPREAGTVVRDDGDAGRALADFLVSRKFL